MKDTGHKIYISKEMLRDYATMDKRWTDITLIPFSKVTPDDIECSEYYRMDLDDVREVLLNFCNVWDGSRLVAPVERGSADDDSDVLGIGHF